MYEVPDFGAPRMARGSGSLAQPLSALRAAPTTFPTPATPSVGGNAVNPYLMAASGALDAVGSVADYQLKKRQYNLDKQAANRQESQQLLDRMNAQRRRVGETGGKQYLLGQMMQRLGLDPNQLTVAKELAIKPMSGTTRVDQQFANYYGMRPEDQMTPEARARMAASQAPAPQVRLGNSMGTNNVADMMRRAMIGGGR